MTATTISRSIEFIRPLIDHHFNNPATSSTRNPLIIGISGPQGSGKSYLAAHLSSQLSTLYPTLNTVDVSTDDFYLTFAQQQQLQLEHQDNWMISGRGPPGTHDLKLLNLFVRSVKNGDVCDSIPRYDKSAHDGRGDRFPQEEWTKVGKTIDILIIEGWFNGYRSLSNEKLYSKWDTKNLTKFTQQKKLVTLSNLEFVNQLLHGYELIWDQFDLFLYLSTSDLQNVYKWRIEQEHALKAKTGGVGMSDDEVVRFVDRYMPCYYLYYDELQHHGCLSEGCNLKLEIDFSRNLIDDDVL